MKKKKGFTLVEMIAVIAIIGITGALVFTLFGKTHKVFTISEKESRNIDEVRLVLSSMEEDIKLSKEKIKYDEFNMDDYKFEGLDDVLLDANMGDYRYIYIKQKVKNNTEINKYKSEKNKESGKEDITKIATLSSNIENTPIIEPVPSTDNSYKISIKDNEDLEYQTIVTRRK